MGWRIGGLDPEIWHRAGEILAALGKHYPVLEGFPRKPMAIGSGDTLAQRADEFGFTLEDIQIAMIRHTRSTSYLVAMAEGGARYTLDGDKAGEITDAEVAYAKATIAKRRQREAGRSTVRARSGRHQEPAVVDARPPTADDVANLTAERAA